MKLVSVIIPVYNRPKLVVDAINSVLLQNYKNIEIIVVDDGSNDKTLDVLQKLQEKQPQIKIISQKNSGVLKARIAGVKKASGEYVVFLDSDDILGKDFIFRLVETQSRTNSDVVLSRRFQKYGPLKILYNKFPTQINLSEQKGFLPVIWVGMTCKLYKRDSLDIRDYGLKANEDLAFNYYDLVQKENIGCNNRALYIQRLSEDSIARELIYGNIDHIENTLMPLEKEKELFEESKMLEEYYIELEAIFIKNIMERIININSASIPPTKKKDLMGILIRYLNGHFPNWRFNKYYLNGFKGFPVDAKLYVNLAKVLIRKIDTQEKSDYRLSLENFQTIARSIHL